MSNLTAALLVIHAMIGCCHHHWHSSDAFAAAPSSICAPPCVCCNACCESPDQSDQPAEPCNGQHECQGVCTYLPTQKTVIDASTADVAFDFAAAIPSLLTGPLADSLAWDRAHVFNDSAPPLRLHLLHQILLI